jgi:hypothetical protein
MNVRACRHKIDTQMIAHRNCTAAKSDKTRFSYSGTHLSAP